MLIERAHSIPPIAYYSLHAIPLLLAVEYRVRTSTVSFTLAELSLPIAVLAMAFATLYSARVRLDRHCVLAALITCTTAFLSIFLQRDFYHTVSVYRDLILPILFYLAFISVRLRSQWAAALAKAFIGWATLSSALAITQFYTNDYLWFQPDDVAPWQEFKSGLVAASSVGQLMGATNTLPPGLCSHPNNLAAYLVIPLLITYALVRSSELAVISRCLWALCGAIQLFALSCTFMRSSLLTLIAGIVGFEGLVGKRRRVRFRAFVGCLVLIIAISYLSITSEAFSFDDLGTLRARRAMFDVGVSLLLEHPLALLIGGLTEVYMDATADVNQLVHNLFMYMVLQFGAITLIGWLTLFISELRHSARLLFEASDTSQRMGGAIVVGVAVSIGFYGQTYSMLDNVQIGLWLCFWLGITVHLAPSEANGSRACA